MTLLMVRKALVAGLTTIVTVLLVAMICLEIAQVFLRYFLLTGVIWAREVSTLMMFSLGWLGAPLLWLQRTHLSVDILPAGISGSRWLNRVLDLLALACGIVLLVYTSQAMAAFRFIDLPALGTSAAVKFWPMVAGSTLLSVAALVNLFAGRARA